MSHYQGIILELQDTGGGSGQPTETTKGSASGIGFSETPGRTLIRTAGAVSGLRFGEVAGGMSVTVTVGGAFANIGFSEIPGQTVEMSAPAGSGLRLGEVSGAFLANVIAAGASVGLGFDETAGGISATVTAAGASSTIGFGEETTRENEVSEVEMLAGLGFSGIAGKNVEMQPGILSGLGLGAFVGAIRDINPGSVEGLAFGLTAGALNYSAWVRANKAAAVYSYYATITGAADGLADYTLSGLKSIQIRARNNEPSYLSVSIPYSDSDIAAIQARQNGELVVDMAASIGGVEALREELLRTDFHSVRYDQGPRNRSITVIGYRTQTFGAGAVALDNVVTESMLADGKLHYRCAKPDFFLKPGHTVTYGANEFTAAMVSCIINPTYQFMEVQE